ncbi:MAG: hypothetical protein AAF732_01535 [Pseudomonadota bacterium]
MCLKRVLVAAVLVVAVPASTPRAVEIEGTKIDDSRAKALYDAFKERKQRKLTHDLWDAEKGPWASYLGVPFKNGLSPREKKLYETAVRTGLCDTVQALQLVGFLQLYPFLRSAHARFGVSQIFKNSVIDRSLDSRYCSARSNLIIAMRYVDVYQLNIVFPINLKRKRPIMRDPNRTITKPERAQNSICGAMSSLVFLAFEDDYKPAMRDLLEFVDQKELVQLPPAVDYYLRKRARRLGIPADTPYGDPDPAYHDLEIRDRIGIELYAERKSQREPLGLSMLCPKPRIDLHDVK